LILIQLKKIMSSDISRNTNATELHLTYTISRPSMFTPFASTDGHRAFTPPTNRQNVFDALQTLKDAYPDYNSGNALTVTEHPLNTGREHTGSDALTAWLVVDGSNVAMSYIRSNDEWQNAVREADLLHYLRTCVRALKHVADHLPVVPCFNIVTQDPNVAEWWNTFITTRLDTALLKEHVYPPQYYLVEAPHGTLDKPGLYEDQLVVDISNTIVRVLRNSADWSGRVVLVTADGSDRSGDSYDVEGVNGPSEDFPTHINRVNERFARNRTRNRLEPYYPVWHVTPTRIDNTSYRHKTGEELTYGVEAVAHTMDHWPMDWTVH
jgi:hypothetical protein